MDSLTEIVEQNAREGAPKANKRPSLPREVQEVVNEARCVQEGMPEASAYAAVLVLAVAEMRAVNRKLRALTIAAEAMESVSKSRPK